MYCQCGNTRCLCQGRCRCCSCICYCTACSSLRGYQDQLCHRCRYARDCERSASESKHPCDSQPVLQPWQVSGLYPDLDFLSSNSRESSGASGKRQSSPENFLIFQMDDIDSPSDRDSPKTPEQPVIRDLPGASQRLPVITISKPDETHVVEMPIIQDLTGYSQLNPNATVSKSGESQIIENASDASSSEELSELSNGPPSSKSSVSPRSPTHPLSTSAPSLFDVPESSNILKLSKQNVAAVSNISETSSASSFPKIETLRISVSHSTNKTRTASESSSLIKTLSIDLLPNSSETVPNCEVPSNSVSSHSLRNALAPIKTLPVERQVSQTWPPFNLLRLSISEDFHSTKQKSSSE